MAPINWSQISLYDIAKDFVGPALTILSTGIVLFFSLHKPKPKIEKEVYTIPDDNYLNKETTYIKFYLNNESVGLLNLKDITISRDSGTEKFYLDELKKTNYKSTNHIPGKSLKNLRNPILLTKYSPVHTEAINVSYLTDEIVKTRETDLLQDLPNIEIILNFETNDKYGKMPIKVRKTK